MSKLARALLCFALVTSVAGLTPGAAARPQLYRNSTGGGHGGRPVDYSEMKGLSQPRFKKIVRDSYMVEMKDGVQVYVEVVRPKEKGRYGTILELSPYHGTLADRSGTRILPGPKDKQGTKLGLAGYFAPRGYAVVFVDLRGTGRSQGCLDHLGANDQSDSYEIVEWAAKQPWSNGRVGMTGHSYVGSTPQMTAAQNPPHLETIVPSAGLGAMYHHEFQYGVPYFLQWAGPLFAYPLLSTDRHLPPGATDPASGGKTGDNFGNDPQYIGCGWQASVATTGEAYFSGAETDWHRERDFRKGATKSKIPMFLVHGVNDNAARIAGIDWFNARGGRPGDKAWIGQWDHGSDVAPNTRTCSQAARVPCLDDEWTSALHAWFDKHLLGRRVSTGPALEAFLNNREVFTSIEWPPSANKLTFYPAPDGSLATSVAADESALMFVADPRGYPSNNEQGYLVFETPRLKRDTLVIGVPRLHLATSVTFPRIHIHATMYDVDKDGERQLGRAGFAVNPELREGIDNPQPVVPGEVMHMNLDGMAQAHFVEKGHRIRLVFTSEHPDKVPIFATGSLISIHVGGENGTRLQLPVIYDPKLWMDPMFGG
jgi:predicted acyl esterase